MEGSIKALRVPAGALPMASKCAVHREAGILTIWMLNVIYHLALSIQITT